MPYSNFKLAFGVVGYYDRKNRDDKQHVEWSVKLHSVINKVTSIEYLTYHKCTEEDFQDFYEPKPSQSEVIASLKEQ